MQTFIPTPNFSAVGIGPFTIHLYALAILLGIIVALVVGRHRYVALGANPEEIFEVAIWAVPAGIVGGRLYHVVTSPDAYFGAHGRPWDALKIWQGGMGIWGAIALGALVAFWRFRSAPRSLPFANFADALAPGILLAQAIGRWGNWFNGELFGSPSTLPWALKVPSNLRPMGYENIATYHPTFLYESLWSVAMALLLIFLPFFRRQAKFRPGFIFISYIFLYSVGRIWIEALRIDQAHHIFGVRLNIWVAGIVILLSGGALFSRLVQPGPARAQE
ncbi:MAG: prolipoprotein diacylglyceryl transferase [Actinomycetes bacterium]